MLTIPLNEHYLAKLKTYFYAHRFDHDESFLSPEEIEHFKIDDENPTIILLENNEIIGCLSIMYTPYFLKSKKARVRMFHCINSEYTHYALLIQSFNQISKEAEYLELFIPDHLAHIKKIYESLGISFFRRSYVMIRKNKKLLHPTFPHDFELK